MRVEYDALGQLELDDDTYYGIQTERASKNVSLDAQTLGEYPRYVWCMAAIKKAAARANSYIGELELEIAGAICSASDEVMGGKMNDQFPVSLYQGVGGTSINMNINEVIANRANEILTGRKGSERVHPNTHVNMCQSTNDTIPSATIMTSYLYLKDLQIVLVDIEKTLSEKVDQFKDVVKIGRTCWQDAVPITLGQEFSGYLGFIKRQKKELESLYETCKPIIVGGTAVGTGLGTLPGYMEAFYKFIPNISGIPVIKSSNFYDGMQNADDFLKISSFLNGLAIGLSKMANDIRVLSSGPRAGLSEIYLKALQPGSSIMPGKVNPVIPETIIQISYQVQGNNHIISTAADRGEVDANVWDTVFIKNLCESFELLIYSVEIFNEECLKEIDANVKKCYNDAEMSLSNATVLSAIFGYEVATKITQEAIEKNISLKEIAVEKGLLTQSESDELLNPLTLTNIENISELLQKYRKEKL